MFLKQSTAYTFRFGPFLDDTDGKTAETGLSISQADIRLSKGGGNFAQKSESSTSTHDEIGFYIVALDATDTNTCGELLIACHESGALPVFKTFYVLEEAIYDAMFAASASAFDANARVDVASIEGSDATDQINAACDTALSDYDAPTKAELDSAFTEIKGGSWSASTDTLEAIRDRGDASWVTATGFNTTTPPTAAAIRSEIDSNSTQLAAIVADTNELQGDWANGGRLDLLLDSAISKIDVVDGIVDNILVDTAEIGAAGAGLTAVPWNSAWDAEVQSECNDALVAIGLDHIVSASVAGSDIADDSIVAKLVSKESTADWDDFDNTTDSLQAIRDRGDASWTTGSGGGGGGGGASAADIADAVWDEAVSAHSSAGTFGKYIADILTDTGEIGAAGAGLTAVPWNSAWDAEVQSECADALTAHWGATLTESYASDNAAATPAQLLHMIYCAVSQFSISGTTITGYKIDGSTTAMTWTLDDASNPVERKRAT
ncbi:MAG: hypothetical protein Unbinned1524contig1001_8 [Prokaryotic dsDNA virus sp.]|nr:MAG: hypothetical protein Unbinned1524contig1001_8 [Prokaryotic dsDNA virus sp.]|tara:strand:+ start:4231 stop:5706 length:1476 start_codon:yes stop_codon:yes gene_type:complete